MFKVFGVVGDGLSELFDLIFKLLMRKTNWRFGFAGVLQINDVILSLN